MDEHTEKSTTTRPHRRSVEMFPLVEEYLEGGQNQKSFCSEQSVPISVFSYWLRKYRESQEPRPEPGFVAVRMPERSSQAVEIEFPGGKKLRFDRLPDLNYLKALLAS